MKEILQYTNANKLHKEYFPHIKCFSHKLCGRGPFGRKISFNKDEEKDIMQGLDKWINDMHKKYHDMHKK